MRVLLEFRSYSRAGLFRGFMVFEGGACNLDFRVSLILRNGGGSSFSGICPYLFMDILALKSSVDSAKIINLTWQLENSIFKNSSAALIDMQKK